MALYLLAVSGNASTAAIASVVSGCVAALVAYLTKRSSDQASIAIAETTTRGQVEEEAFERAKSFYTDTIDRQAAEIREQAEEILALKGRANTCEVAVAQLRAEVRHYRRTGQRLARGVHELRLALGQAAAPDAALDQAVVDMLADDDRGVT